MRTFAFTAGARARRGLRTLTKSSTAVAPAASGGARPCCACECRSPRPRVRKCAHIPWASRPHQICEDPPRGIADARRPLPFAPRLASLKAAHLLGRERPLPLSRATKTHSCSRADRLYPNLPTASSLVLSSVMEPQNVRKSGVVLRKVQRNDKWVRRWLQVSGARFCVGGSSVRIGRFASVSLGTERPPPPRRIPSEHRAPAVPVRVILDRMERSLSQ